MQRRLVLLALGIAVALTVFALVRSRSRTATPEAPNVLVIAIDTLRADRLGCLGNERGLTPALDRLAGEGVSFRRAFAHAPWTLPSFASIFTSQTPEEHGAGGKLGEFRALAPEHTTLAERFAESGWKTGAIVNVDFLGRAFGLMQGFDVVDERFSNDNDHLRDAHATTDAALAWIEKERANAFFLLVHYFDPHARYAPPKEFRERFADPRDQHSDAFEFGTRDQVVLWRSGRIHPTQDDFRRAEQLYDGEVAYTDAEVGRLIDGLAAAGLDANTLVVVVADHGEEFLDHGDWEHGHSLHDELLHVPMLLRQKGRIAARVVEGPVGTIDLAPTVCGLAGVPPSPDFRGRDLSPALAGSALSPHSLCAFGNFWGAPHASLRTAEWKLIERPGGGAGGSTVSELYRWTEDAREKVDRAASEPAARARLAEDLALLRKVFVGRARQGPRVRMSPEQRERLKNNGYVGGGDEDER
ncbi:MAG: sulfatase [Planctomycetes bacterium]|nr:sulfatase [Planctomycetota bacterium]